MQPMKASVDSLKQLIQALQDAGLLIFMIEKDKGVNMDILAQIMKLINETGDVVKSLGSVIPEFKDLDDAERADLVAFVEKTISLPNVTVEFAIEQVLKILILVSKLFKRLGLK